MRLYDPPAGSAHVQIFLSAVTSGAGLTGGGGASDHFRDLAHLKSAL